jgi:hypothetical protein
MLLFSPIKILEKKGKKRVLSKFWSKMPKNAKFEILPKIALFCTPFTLFILFTYK